MPYGAPATSMGCNSDELQRWGTNLRALARRRRSQRRGALGVGAVRRRLVSAAICRLPSFICHLSSVICRLPSFTVHLPLAIVHLSSPICHLSSITCLSSIHRRPGTVPRCTLRC